MKILIVILIILLSTWILNDDECSSYSDFSCDEIQDANYNAYFYFPNDKEKYLGVSTNLDQCGSMAYKYAASKNLSRNDKWSYICCMKAKGSECYEKHK
jgi:hypothetical protein